MEIAINDRLKQQINDFCQLNKIDVNTYLSDKIMEGFSVDRFGDLNDLVDKEEIVPKKEIEEKIEITNVVYETDSEQFVLTINNKEYRVGLKQIEGFSFLYKKDESYIDVNNKEGEKKDEVVETRPKIRKREIKSK